MLFFVGTIINRSALDLPFRRSADSVLAQTANWSCPAGRAFFLSLNKKKQKINTGAAPLCTR